MNEDDENTGVTSATAANEDIGAKSSYGDFDEGDVGSTSVFGGQGGGSAGDFDPDFNYAGYQDKLMDDLDVAANMFTQLDAALSGGKTAVMGGTGEIRGFGIGRYGADDAAFYAQAIGNTPLADRIRSDYVEPSYANQLGDYVSSKFGTSSINKYGIDPARGYVGEVVEDYSGTDFVGNVLATLAPTNLTVDRFGTRELTTTGLGDLEFGVSKGSLLNMDISQSYAVTPEQQRQMDINNQKKPPENDSVDFDPRKMLAQTRTPVTARTLMQSRPQYSYTTQDNTNPFSYFQGPSSATAMYDTYAAAIGGPMGEQQNGQQEPVTGPVGFVGGPPEQMSEAETVADDVPVEVQEGAYVLNAAAVEYMGSADVKRMILEAMQELKSQGVDKAQNIDKIGLDSQISLLVSKGEVLIPPQVAQVIGYDRLEKINRRGIRETEKRIEENGQSPEAEALDQQPVNPAEGMAMAPGGTAGSIIFEEMPYATVEGPENRARVLKKAQEADPEGFAEINRKNTDDLADWMNISQFYTDDYVAKSPAPIQKLDRFLLENAAYNMSVQYGSEDNMFIMLGERGKDPDPARGLKTGRVGDKDAIITLPGEEKDAPLLYHESGHVAQPRDLEQSTVQQLKNRATDLFKSLTRPVGEPGKPQEEVAVTSLDLYRALHQGDMEKVIGSIEYLDYQFKRQGFGREFVPDFTTDEGVEKLARNAAEYALEVVDSQDLYSKDEKQSLVQDIADSFTKNAETIKKLGTAYRSGEYSPTVEAYRRNRMATGGISSREEMLRQIDEDPSFFYESRVAGEMGPALAEAREIRDGVNGMFNVHRMYEKLLRDIEEYKAPEVMSRTNVEMGQTQSQRDTTLMESDGIQPLVIDDMTPQNAANMYQNFPSFRTYIMDRIEADQSEQVQSVLDNYEKFLKDHSGDNVPKQNPVYTEEDFAKARELDETETLRDLLNSRVVSETPVEGFISKSY